MNFINQQLLHKDTAINCAQSSKAQTFRPSIFKYSIADIMNFARVTVTLNTLAPSVAPIIKHLNSDH